MGNVCMSESKDLFTLEENDVSVSLLTWAVFAAVLVFVASLGGLSGE